MKRLFLSFFISFLTYFAYSQQFDGGPITGFSVSQVDGDSLSGYNKVGPVAGLYITRKINENFHIKLELKYVQKGSKSKGSLEENSDFYAIRLQYIELPVVLQYHFSNKIDFEAGLAEGYLFKSQEDYDGNGYTDTRYPYYKTETSILGGINFNVTDHFQVNARINYSLLRISKYTQGGRLWIRRGKFNNVLSFTLNYKF